MKQKRKNKKSRLALSFTFMKGCAGYFVLCIVFSALASLCELICPKIISFTVDCVIGDEECPALLAPIVEKAGGMDYLTSHLYLTALTVIITAVFMGAFRYLSQVLNRRGAETLVENMRNRLYSHMERLPSSWFMKNRTGDIIQRCTSDVETVKSFLSDQLTSVIGTVLLIVISLFFMYSTDTTLATIALVTIPIIIVYSVVFCGKIEDGFLKCDENEGKLSSIAQENLTGVRVVRAFGREKYEVDKFTAQNRKYTDFNIHLGLLMAMFWQMGDLISGLQQMIVLILGTVFCVEGRITVGGFIAAVSYNSMLIWPVRDLGKVIAEMSKAGISFGRIDEIMSAEEESDRPNSIDCDASGDIVFEHVSFSYEDGTRVLDDVSLEIKKGETVGILGMTGSGKSTLVQLLCRLYELPEGCGRITVNGADIRDIKAASLRKSIGIVLQEPFLFSRSIGENIGISFDNPAGHESEIRESARIACLDETIESFKNGYSTPVGERGVTLSGGQKQRCAIARLLTRKTPVMIFDDSLSAVDSETDGRIRSALRERSSGCTVIIISHRIQTLMNSDKIAVMSGGKIIEEGTHEELLSLGGVYKKINDIQSSDADDNTDNGKEADT